MVTDSLEYQWMVYNLKVVLEMLQNSKNRFNALLRHIESCDTVEKMKELVRRATGRSFEDIDIWEIESMEFDSDESFKTPVSGTKGRGTGSGWHCSREVLYRSPYCLKVSYCIGTKQALQSVPDCQS